MPSVAALGIDAPCGPLAVWPPRAAPTPQRPGAALPWPEDFPLLSRSGLVDIAQLAGRVAVWFAGRDSWMQAETHRRDDSSVQSRRVVTKQRSIDDLHNVQFTLDALRRREEQQRQEAQRAAAPSPIPQPVPPPASFNGDDHACPICLDDFIHGAQVVRLACRHILHWASTQVC